MSGLVIRTTRTIRAKEAKHRKHLIGFGRSHAQRNDVSRGPAYVYWVVLKAAYGPITRPYGHACLVSAEGREGVFRNVYGCILEGV